MVASIHISSVEIIFFDTCAFQDQFTSVNDIDMEIRDIKLILDHPPLSKLLQDRATSG